MATSLYDNFDPRKPNNFGDAAAQSRNPATRGVAAFERPMSPADAKAFGLPQPPNPNAIPGGNAVPGMSATELPPRSNPAVGPGGSAEAKAFQASRTLGNSFGDAAALAKAPGVVQPGGTPLGTAWEQMRGIDRGMGPIRPVGVARQAANVAGRVAGPAGLALGVIDEGLKAKAVYDDKNTTGLDVATQAAEGAGRFGLAGAGALGGMKLGAMAGAGVGSIVPGAGTVVGGLVGGAVGGLAGGWGGYKAADTVIREARKTEGLDTTSPIDRIAAPVATAPTAPGAGEQAQVRRLDNAFDVAQPTMTRTGNSFSDGSAMPGDLSASQRSALGVRNGGVGYIGGGVSAAERLGQINRDIAFQQEKQTWRNPGEQAPGMVAFNTALDPNRNQKFNDDADLRTALSRTTWSPRTGTRLDPGAEVIAGQIRARQQNELGLAKVNSDQTIAARADATDRRNADVRSADTRYSADSTVRASSMKNAYDMQVKAGDRMAQAEALRLAGGDLAKASQILAGSGRDPSVLTGMAAAANSRQANDQTVESKAISNFKDSIQMFGPDGKPDDAATAGAMRAINKIMPGALTQDETSRQKNAPKVEALAGIFQKTFSNPQMGVDKLNPFNPRDAQSDSLPNFKGGTLKRQGIGGAFTPGSGVRDYYVEMPDGRSIPLGQLTASQKALIEKNTSTGDWK